MKHLTLAALAAAMTISATTAFAADKQPAPVAQDTYFNRLDANRDGVVTKEEWRIRGDKMFDDMDANHDGKITPEEKKAHAATKEAEWKAKNPGAVTKAAAKPQNAAPAAVPAAPAKH